MNTRKSRPKIERDVNESAIFVCPGEFSLWREEVEAALSRILTETYSFVTEVVVFALTLLMDNEATLDPDAVVAGE